MRIVFASIVLCAATAAASGPCAVVINKANVDAARGEFTVQYENATANAIRAVQFTLHGPAGDGAGSVTNYSSAGMVPAHQRRTVVFHVMPGARLSAGALVGVTRVSFGGGSTAKLSGGTRCEVEVGNR